MVQLNSITVILHFLRAGKKCMYVCSGKINLRDIYFKTFSSKYQYQFYSWSQEGDYIIIFPVHCFKFLKHTNNLSHFGPALIFAQLKVLMTIQLVFFSEFVKPLKFTDKDSQSSKQDWTMQRQLERRFESRSQFLLYGCVFFLLAKILCGSLQNNKRN